MSHPTLRQEPIEESQNIEDLGSLKLITRHIEKTIYLQLARTASDTATDPTSEASQIIKIKSFRREAQRMEVIMLKTMFTNTDKEA
jgi:hypothetical protein